MDDREPKPTKKGGVVYRKLMQLKMNSKFDYVAPAVGVATASKSWARSV